jgi:ribose-phosphate pyrophosphokinase
MKIISGTAHRELSERIAASLGTELADVTVTAFPDGETFVKINENVRGQDVFLIQPTCPPTNQNLMELLIMVDAARRASAERITAVIPFFGYARQDRKDQPRVPITAKLVANLLSAAGVQRVLTMDLHAAQIQGFFDIPVDHLYAKPVLINFIRDQNIGADGKLVVVSPDVGGVKVARAYSDALGATLAIVTKHRVSATQVEPMHLIGEVEGCDAIVIDDMTETAGTLCSAAEILEKNGARRIFAGVSHGILGDLGRERIRDSAIEMVITTDSVPQAGGEKVHVCGVAPLLSDAIRRISEGQSVSSLFEV